MLSKVQWLEFGAMQIDDDDSFGSIQIAALELESLVPEAKSRIKENTMFDNKYRDLCKQVTLEGIINKGYSIENELLCWNKRLYVAEGLPQRVWESEEDSQVVADFGRERTLELI
jgi:hypothetical protein